MRLTGSTGHINEVKQQRIRQVGISEYGGWPSDGINGGVTLTEVSYKVIISVWRDKRKWP